MEADENMLVGFEFNWDTDPPEVQQTKWVFVDRGASRQEIFYPAVVGSSSGQDNVPTPSPHESHLRP